jgi:hypothetical protein
MIGSVFKARSILIFSALITLATLGPSAATAQEKQKLTFKVGVENTKYTQQYAIDVGDVPGHQIRIFEIRRLTKGTVSFDGVAATEQWTRAFTDYIDLNGSAITYGTYIMENGDKIFTHGNFVSQTVANPDGSRKTTTTTVSQIAGGTGKFVGIQGTSKSVSYSDIKAGRNETEFEIDYWMAK